MDARLTLSSLASRLARLTGRFRHDRRGTIAVFFAMAFVPTAACVGAAIDYTFASKVKTRLDAAADLAALAGVKSSSVLPTEAIAKLSAASSFNANAGTMRNVSMGRVNVEVRDIALVRAATVSYAASVPTSFMGLLGVKSIAIAGTATATSAKPAYIDFYLMLDNTPSMGIGATPADVATMVANTSDKCGFACHDLSNPNNNYYKLAKKLNVTTRIDVVRQAVQGLMDQAYSAERVQNQFRFAVYTFGASCTQSTFTTIQTLTSNYGQVRSASNAIDLMSIPKPNYNNDQCTDNNAILSAMNLTIPAPGDGSAAAQPQKVMFFVSDGVTDSYNPTGCTRKTTGGRCQEPLNASYCQALKNRGIKIAVLYTTYLPLPTNSWYNTWISPFQSTIGNNMQTCASPGLYFEVSPTQGIAQALNALFARAVASSRLTQ
ncbi:TadE/TadG family type IV pilus assembly protein [Phreatobacter sp.]|uniref:TadE/TadG family type IV pilus assembly protein n=1 Tax=Phreatobacter sp. TaxID=1966341 RepID=UPI003F711F1D